MRDASSTSAAFPATGAVASESAFNPFAEQGAASTGGRDVIANPSLAEVMQTGTLPDMAWGRADAPVTVIKYASLTCPYCRRFHLETFPRFKREYVDSGKVRFVIREFPIGKSSGTATIAPRCAGPTSTSTSTASSWPSRRRGSRKRSARTRSTRSPRRWG